MEMTAAPPLKSGRMTLILLICLFALPPLMGWLFFLNPQWLPEKHNNNGQLVHPSRSLIALQLRTAEGARIDSAFFSEGWHLLVISEGNCAEACQRQLQRIQQIRRAVGGSQQRIQPLLLQLPATDGGDREAVADPTLRVLKADASMLAAIRRTFDLAESPISDYSFVIDPMGMLMMKHNNNLLSQKLVLKDMETLLKISQSWVKGADYGHN